MTTILLVAHHESLRQSLRDWLAIDMSQCHVVEARDTPTALVLAGDNEPQVIIVDIDTPYASGLQAIHSIRDAVPNAQMVAFGLEETHIWRAGITNAGATAYLPKGTLPTELIPTLRNVLGIAAD
ncbi:MAG: response regulator transcription factor [Chloroflexi bacterium]|nr:response regulator transcription factor [Chloroflexota bacterium]